MAVGKKDLVKQSIKFIGDHFLDILLVVLLIFLYVSYLIVHNVTIEETHPKLKKVVVFENMDNLNDSALSFKETLRNGFCKETERHNNPDLNCNQLDDHSCKNLVKCCVFARQQDKSFKCVSGDSSGPTNITKPAVDEWYYLGKLHKK